VIDYVGMYVSQRNIGALSKSTDETCRLLFHQLVVVANFMFIFNLQCAYLDVAVEF
jgi:hypothetical protein